MVEKLHVVRQTKLSNINTTHSHGILDRTSKLPVVLVVDRQHAKICSRYPQPSASKIKLIKLQKEKIGQYNLQNNKKEYENS